VKTGRLLIRGLVVPISIAGLSKPDTTVENSDLPLKISGLETISPFEMALTNICEGISVYPDGNEIEIDEKGCPIRFNITTSYLLVVSSTADAICGLILTQHEAGHYNRIGYCELQGGRSYKNLDDWPRGRKGKPLFPIKEFRAKLKRLWGGAENIKDVCIE
jgi:hypothetical protein